MHEIGSAEQAQRHDCSHDVPSCQKQNHSSGFQNRDQVPPIRFPAHLLKDPHAIGMPSVFKWQCLTNDKDHDQSWYDVYKIILGDGLPKYSHR